AFTATRMSRPFGSGLAASKSIRASAASMERDFLYPTAFMGFLPCPATSAAPAALGAGFDGDLQGWSGFSPTPDPAESGDNRTRRGPRHFYSYAGTPIFASSNPLGILHDCFSYFCGVAGPVGCGAGDVPGPARAVLGRRTQALLRTDRAARAAGRRQRLCRQSGAEPQPAARRPHLPPLLRRARPAARTDAALAGIGRDGGRLGPGR